MTQEIIESNLSDRELEHLNNLFLTAKNKLIYRPIGFFIFSALIFMIPSNLIPSRSSSNSSENVYEIFGIISPLAWLLIIAGAIVLITIKELEFFGLKQDLSECKKIIKTGQVDRTGTHKREHYVKLRTGNPKFLRSYNRKFSHLRSGMEVKFEVYKNSKILIRIL